METARRHGTHPLGQAGVTLASILLFQGGSGNHLPELLPADVAPSLRLPRLMARLWVGLMEGNLGVLRDSRNGCSAGSHARFHSR